jgi:hypothetical protein
MPGREWRFVNDRRHILAAAAILARSSPAVCFPCLDCPAGACGSLGWSQNHPRASRTPLALGILPFPVPVALLLLLLLTLLLLLLLLLLALPWVSPACAGCSSRNGCALLTKTTGTVVMAGSRTAKATWLG